MSVSTLFDYPEGVAFLLDRPFTLTRGDQTLVPCGQLRIRPGYDPETGELAGLKLASTLCEGGASHDGREVPLTFGFSFPERFRGEADVPFLLPTGIETQLSLDAEVEPLENDGFLPVDLVLTGDCVQQGRQHFRVLLPACQPAASQVEA